MQTQNLRLPLWIVTPRGGHTSPTQAENGLFRALAFTTPGQLTKFLAFHKLGDWQLRLVEDVPGIRMSIADLHGNGVNFIRIDPEPDGTGGQLISIDQLWALT